MSKKKKYECVTCGTTIELHRDQVLNVKKCCSNPNLKLLSFEYEDGENVEEKEKELFEKDLKERFLSLAYRRKSSEASELLVEYIKSKRYIYTTKEDSKSEVWVYKNGIYVPNGRSEIKELLRKILEETFSIYYSTQVLTKIEADTYIDSEDFFKNINKEEVPVQNGILNIFTRELKPFTPEKIFFNKLPVTYNKDSKCLKIEKFLDDVLAKSDDKNVFYELGGFSLIKEYKFEKAFMFHGSGRNGKGKTIDLLRRCIGVENCSSIPLNSLKADSFQISELFGKMLNLAGDLDRRDLKDTGMFKSLTGRDLISGKRKFLRDINFENYAKFVFACNELPMVYDNSKGFWERWILLDFPYYFTTKEEYEKAEEEEKENWKIKDDDILNKITSSEELSGLLNKFLDGIDRLYLQKGFSATEGSEEIKNKWIRGANSFMAFCMDKLKENIEGIISKKSLRHEFKKYCRKNKLSGVSDKMIRATLQEMYGVSESYKAQLGHYNQEWCWEGISFK